MITSTFLLPMNVGILLLSSTLNTSESLPHFRDRIPNGNNVPNPFIPGSVWSGVGHFQAGGGGPRNPFGIDFAQNGFQWTKDLCLKDSDGDGRSNGQELGDPNCIWYYDEDAQPDPEFPAESHPGFADDVVSNSASDTCKDYYDPPQDVKTMDILFSQQNQLNGDRTQYLCEQFELAAPGYGENNDWTTYFHQIKTEVILDNPNVLHHIWIYSCDSGDSSDGNRLNQGSYSCNGIEGNCQIVAGWAVGGKPLCEPQHVGAPIVFDSWTGKKVFKVEAHYDNVQGDPMATDQSGMRLHMTATKRQVESAQVITGMDYWDRQFELEPGQESLVARTNICPTKATLRALDNHGPIWIYQWNPHMHLYGKSLVTEHYRCGVKIGEIGNIPNFEFDNQQSYVLDPPVKVLPGDSLVTTCYYNTSSASGPIQGGEETADEMCDNYLTFYPSLWTEWEPTLFTACTSFEEGVLNNDVTSPFVTLDLAGDIYIENYKSDPEENVAPCCTAGGASNDADAMLASCELNYLSYQGQPCAIDSDCADSLGCVKGICDTPVKSPTAHPITTVPPTEHPITTVPLFDPTSSPSVFPTPANPTATEPTITFPPSEETTSGSSGAAVFQLPLFAIILALIVQKF